MSFTIPDVLTSKVIVVDELPAVPPVVNIGSVEETTSVGFLIVVLTIDPKLFV